MNYDIFGAIGKIILVPLKFIWFFLKLEFAITLILINFLLLRPISIIKKKKKRDYYSIEEMAGPFFKETISEIAEYLKKEDVWFRKLHRILKPTLDIINKGLSIILFPLIYVYLLITKLPAEVKLVFSILVPGLGQFFNRQFIKAFLFAGFAFLIIFIEFDSGDYDGSFDLYDDRIAGEEMPDEISNYWAVWYYYNLDVEYTDTAFMEHIAEINNLEYDIANKEFTNVNDQVVIVDNIKLSNEDLYSYLSTELLKVEEELIQPVGIYGRVADVASLPTDLEIIITENVLDRPTIFYMLEEAGIITLKDTTNGPKIMNTDLDDLWRLFESDYTITFDEQSATDMYTLYKFTTNGDLFYMPYTFEDEGETDFIDNALLVEENGILEGMIIQAEDYAENEIVQKSLTVIDESTANIIAANQAEYDQKVEDKIMEIALYINGPTGVDQYIIDNRDGANGLEANAIERIYDEYYDAEYATSYDTVLESKRKQDYSRFYNTQYNNLFGERVLEFDTIRSFRDMLQAKLSNGSLGMDNDDFNKMLIRIYYEMYPEAYDELLLKVNDYYFERTGFFVQGIWGAITMGSTESRSISVHEEFKYFNMSFGGTGLSADEVQISGHHSTRLLLKGIIAGLVIVYLLVVYVWNVRDAYKSGKQLSENKKPQPDGEYFAELYEDFFEYIVLTPSLILVTFLSVMPILFGLFVAFTNYNIENLPPGNLVSWVGFDNFAQVFSITSDSAIDFGGQFWKVASWTLIWAFAATFTCFFGGFIQAVIINNKRVVFRKAWRSILILPWAMPALISQMIFRVIFNDQGYVNQTLGRAGITELFTKWNLLRPYSEAGSGIQKLFYFGEDTFQWLSNEANPWFVRIFIIVLNVWLGFPFFMALMSGVMTSIDKSLYEAASIDGATDFQKFRFITMPLVLFATSPLLVMTFSGNFNNFGVIYFITGGGPGGGVVGTAYAGSTDILISWIYKLTTDPAIRWYNMASVFSILIFLIIGTLSAWNFTRTRAFKEGD